MIRYITLVLALLSGLNPAKAQTSFTDDFESYPSGALLAESSSVWVTGLGTGGGFDDVPVSSANAHSGTNALFLSSPFATGGPGNVVLPFDDMFTSGSFAFEVWLFVNNGRTAYFNLQGSETLGQSVSMHVTFDSDGSLKFENTGGLMLEALFPHGQWFRVALTASLNNSMWEVSIGSTVVGTFQNPVPNVASARFFSIYNSSFYVDDISFEHIPYVPPVLNAALLNLHIADGLALQTRQPTVTVRNLGSGPITSFDLTLDYNGVQTMQTVSALNLEPDSIIDVEMTQPLTLAAGTFPAYAVVNNVNGAGADGDAADDTAFATVAAVVPAPGKKVVIEVVTGTWCGWCTRGTVYLKKMEQTYSGYFAAIAVHNSDPMEDEAYDTGIQPYLGSMGYPSTVVDRMTAVDPMEMEQQFHDRITQAPAAFVANGATFDAATRELTVSIETAWQTPVDGSQYRLACVLVEDSVTGTTAAWAQSNTYAGGGYGPMGGYELLSDPIPASQMHYDRVARVIAPSFDGGAFFAPMLNAGDTIVHNFTFVLPVTWNEMKMSIIGMVIYDSGPTRYVDNASNT
ncbi:MAG TPA: Omp28-related outer membrane protein, partial [Chitinophagales bacterium]|nr:Omp28-related outer membrane protein [Chitinophagales bacterium]